MRTYVIPKLHQPSMEACRLRIDNLTKPLYSLAHLELMAERLAGILAVEQPSNLRKGIVVFAADHAVDGRQNETHGKESYQVLARMNSGRSATDAVARKLKAKVEVVDLGLESDTKNLAKVQQAKVVAGVPFFGFTEALHEEEAEEAIETGFALADRLSAQGIQAVGIGNVGERALLSALAVTYAVTGYPVKELLTDNECTLSIEEKAARLEAMIARFQLENKDPMKILRSVGGADIAAMVGFILGAASHRMAIVFDNAVTGAAVLLATLLDVNVKDYVFTSAVYEEPVHKAQMRYLEKKAYLYYQLEVDEGLGSAMGLSLLDAALHMLNDMKTFGDATVSVAEDGPGNQRQDAAVKYIGEN